MGSIFLAQEMVKETYMRDGRSPIPIDENVSRVMRGNKAKDTKPELLLRRSLWLHNLRGYRLHASHLPGRPDISYSTSQVAIFVNGCFWHRCPHCKPNFPKSNVDFWQHKFQKNINRDEKKVQALKSTGWKCLVIWECQVRHNLSNCVNHVRSLL